MNYTTEEFYTCHKCGKKKDTDEFRFFSECEDDCLCEECFGEMLTYDNISNYCSKAESTIDVTVKNGFLGWFYKEYIDDILERTFENDKKFMSVSFLQNAIAEYLMDEDDESSFADYVKSEEKENKQGD